jgi:hypothetical protein
MLRALLSAGIACGLTGCLIDLERGIACGDGYVDEGQGEECDPGKPSSYLGACEGTEFPLGQGDCDEETCQLINDKAQCSVCGDDIIDVDAGEECDLSQLGSGACRAGGVLTCKADCTFDYSACEQCGDGDLDDGEECDPRTGGFVQPQLCMELATAQYPYWSGSTTTCNDDCKWDRTTCGYCGNGRRDVQQPVTPNFKITEFCDGDDFDDELLDMMEPNNDCMARDDLRVNAECNPDTCNDYELRDDPDVCCIKPGELCPQPSPGGGVTSFKCCYEFSHPDETGFCEDRTTINDEGQLETSSRCK